MSGFFVGVGVAKSGTTWLSDYLRKHPEVFMPGQKEMHVFDALYAHENQKLGRGNQMRKLRSAMERSKHKEVLDRAFLFAILRSGGALYRPFFEYRRGNKPVYGEFTPGYSALDEKGFAAIREQFPEAKLIFMMRNPVDRLWSHVRHQGRRAGRIRGADSPRATADPIEALQAILARPGHQLLRRGNYAATLQAIDAVFPARQLFTIFYEDLFGGKGPEIIAQLTDFLGVAPHEADFSAPSNAAPKPEKLPPEVRAEAVAALTPVYRYVIERFGEAAPASWQRDLDWLDSFEGDAAEAGAEGARTARSGPTREWSTPTVRTDRAGRDGKAPARGTIRRARQPADNCGTDR